MNLKSRTAYVSREQGAAELQVSPSTWNELVASGKLPKPRQIGSILRWRWQDSDATICKDDAVPLEPFFREQTNGTPKESKRRVA